MSFMWDFEKKFGWFALLFVGVFYSTGICFLIYCAIRAFT